MKEVSSHILRLTGKAELPHEIQIGNNYHVSLAGAIRTVAETDCDDGTVARSYTFKAIKVEVLDELGKTIVAKDTRSESQLTRALVYKYWVNMASREDFEEFYSKFHNIVRRDLNKILEELNN